MKSFRSRIIIESHANDDNDSIEIMLTNLDLVIIFDYSNHYNSSYQNHDKGQMGTPKRMNFRKSFKGGGGVVFNSNIYVAKFGPLNRAFSA